MTRSPELPLSLDLEPADATALRTAWTREQPLGLEGSVAATLLDPAVGLAMLAGDARTRRIGGIPDSMSRQTWLRWYADGRELPVLVRWRFARHFHAEAVTEPSAWQLQLVSDDRLALRPLRRGRLTRQDDDEAWAGNFTIWFPWRQADGRNLLGRSPRRLRLIVSGSPGKAELQWRFAPVLSDERNVTWGLDP
ncbi:MAG: hypothetical protein VKO21_01255 [Candidatus Sericytochromatia bacterium]|nr:hypothetical protein [Candidatus Sericytochromatia bacterium]